MTHEKTHIHVPLVNGRAKVAQTYPDALCKAICKGIVQQIQADRQGKFLSAALSTTCSEEARQEQEGILEQIKLAEEPDHPDLLSATDDVSGAPLDSEQVYKARMEEVAFIREMGLYEKLPVEECW